MRASKPLLILLAAVLFVPSLTFARNGEDERRVMQSPEASHAPEASRTPRASRSPEATRSPEAGRGAKVASTEFCARFGEATGRLSDDTTSRFSELRDNFAGRGKQIDVRFGELSHKQSDSRAQWDRKQADSFAELEAKAATPEQKAAVATFKASVVAATTQRRAAVDAANAAFKAGLQSAVDGRQTQLNTAATAYKAAVATALANAKAGCAAGVATATVRTNLQSALAVARANLATARKRAGGAGTGLEVLKAARKAAVDRANAQYKVSVKAALATLKTALGVAPSRSPRPE